MVCDRSVLVATDAIRVEPLAENVTGSADPWRHAQNVAVAENLAVAWMVAVACKAAAAQRVADMWKTGSAHELDIA